MRSFISITSIIRQIKSRRLRWAGHVARLGEERKVYNVLVGKPERKRLLGRPRSRWDQINLRGRSCKVWIGFMWLRIGTCGRLL
jgi:hypothetical protein